MAIGALALDESELSWETIQKAIHGAVPAGGGGGRVDHTGIKHSVTNMIRLPGQFDYFDRLPCVLIVPTLTLHEVKNWNGGGYQAMVMVGPPSRDAVDSAGRTVNLQSICAAIGMLNEGDIALPGHIHTAQTLLSQFVLGLAYSLFRRYERYSHHTDENEQGEFNLLRINFSNPRGGVVVPERNRAGQPWRVRLVTFRGVTEARDLHVAPDPYLLTVKAAVNWSRRHDQKLLAAAEPQDGDEEIDDLSALEMRRFLAVQRDAARDDLAKLVDQPGGFQVAF